MNGWADNSTCFLQGAAYSTRRLDISAPRRRVSTTLTQVLTEFSELFSFPPRNFSPGSPSNDDRRLGRPTASPLFLSSSGFRFSKVDRCCFICLRLQTAVSEGKPVC